jgi:hypothetical protein
LSYIPTPLYAFSWSVDKVDFGRDLITVLKGKCVLKENKSAHRKNAFFKLVTFLS